MAVEITAGATAQQAVSNAYQGFLSAGWIGGLFVVGVIIFGIIAFLMIYFSYNVEVWIKRPLQNSNGFVIEKGYRGKYAWSKRDTGEKEQRFFIWLAKSKKIQYNQEPPDSKFINYILHKGKIRKLIILEPDSENWLHPVELRSKNQGVVEAEISNADVSFAIGGIEDLASKYTNRPAYERFMPIILLIIGIVIVGLAWYTAHTNSKTFEVAVQNMGAMKAACEAITANINNSTTQLIPL